MYMTQITFSKYSFEIDSDKEVARSFLSRIVSDKYAIHIKSSID